MPVAKVFFYSDLLPNSIMKGEGEYIVIGGEYRVKVIPCTVVSLFPQPRLPLPAGRRLLIMRLHCSGGALLSARVARRKLDQLPGERSLRR